MKEATPLSICDYKFAVSMNGIFSFSVFFFFFFLFVGNAQAFALCVHSPRILGGTHIKTVLL